MAYRYGNRPQQLLLPSCIEDYVASDAPVRVYDAFVEALYFDELGIELNTVRVGNSSYDPKAMLKLLVYGYSYGVRSSHKLERETHYNMSFIWLLGGLKQDHKTIAEFRRKHRSALAKVLKQCVRFCLKLDLIDGNTLFVDGSKVRANASRDRHWSEKRCLKRLEKINRRIEEIFSECDFTDDQESSEGSLVRIEAELNSQAIYKLRKQKVELPFGHIKRNLKADHFLQRGLRGVRSEVSLLAICFNIVRMITLVGVQAMIARLSN